MSFPTIRAVQLAAAGLAAAAGIAVVAVSASATSPVGPTPTPRMTADAVSCVLDSLGVCTVSHALGVVPTAVVVSANTPAGWNGFMLNTVRDSFTPTTFKVRAMVTSTQPKNGATIWFSYSAFAAAPTPPSTSTQQPTATITPTVTTEPTAVTTTR